VDRGWPDGQDQVRQLTGRVSTATNTAGKPITVGNGPIAIAIG
jgi:hypothetical protein